MVQVHSIWKLTLKKSFNKNPSSFRHSEENRQTSFLSTRRNHRYCLQNESERHSFQYYKSYTGIIYNNSPYVIYNN